MTGTPGLWATVTALYLSPFEPDQVPVLGAGRVAQYVHAMTRLPEFVALVEVLREHGHPRSRYVDYPRLVACRRAARIVCRALPPGGHRTA